MKMRKEKRIKHQQSFWKKVRFKYRLSFMNENSLEEVFVLRLSFFRAFCLVALFAVLLIILTSLAIAKTPIRTFLPGQVDGSMRNAMVSNALKTDSLEEVVKIQTRYFENIQSIMRGDEPETPNMEVGTLSTTSPSLEKSDETAEFVKSYEEEEKYNLNTLSSGSTLPDNLIFYRPARGIISTHFDSKEKHYGIDISTNPKESVLATMKGTVVFNGFDASAGYVIQIQHPNGFVSIYKHNAALLKKEGDSVNAGEAIAIAGNTGHLSSGSHLHFELWYGGKPINPEEFIVF